MADKNFGVRRINLIGASGTPTVTSPNNLNLNATQVSISTDLSIGGQIVSNVIIGSLYSVGIGTTNPVQILDVRGNINVSGGVTATTFSGQVNAGVSTLGIATATNLTAQQLNASGISTFAGITTVTGSTLFAKQLNVSGVTTITGNLNAPGNYFVKLARLTNQTILTGTDTLIGFTATSDTNGWYSGITTRTTPTVAGNYQVQVMLNWQGGTTTNANQSNIQLRKNGNTFAISIVGIQTFQYAMSACGIVSMNGTTDYIDFTAYTSNATSQTVTGDAGGLYTKLEIFKLN